MYPRARAHGVLVKPLDDELVLYDQERHRAHRLNATAALVWQHCNGERSVAELARLLSAEMGHPVGEDTIHLALSRLAEAELLLGPAAEPPGVSRRAALRRAASMAGLALLPVVTSIAAPTPADAQSGPSGGGPGKPKKPKPPKEPRGPQGPPGGPPGRPQGPRN